MPTKVPTNPLPTNSGVPTKRKYTLRKPKPRVPTNADSGMPTNSTLPTKQCTDCLLIKPLTDFYSYAGSNGKTYHHSYCRECHTVRTGQARRARKARAKGTTDQG